jgi:DNA polymerase elongation subunit (family B)
MVTKKIKFKDKPSQKEIDEMLKQHPLGWVEEVELKAKLPKKDGGGFKKAYWFNYRIANSLNVVIDGLCYVFGTGGAHAAVEKRVIVSDEKRVIRTFDVSSFYPNLSIKNKIYPEHLGVEFCDIYENLYNMRKTFDKKSAENAMLKLALNGTYGNSNNEYSPFYDPKFTMSITLNGQMLLCKAIEMVLSLPTVEILMANTDGFEFIIDREYEALAEAKCKEWEDITGLTLEGDTYTKMVISDVNNYFSIYEENK